MKSLDKNPVTAAVGAKETPHTSAGHEPSKIMANQMETTKQDLPSIPLPWKKTEENVEVACQAKVGAQQLQLFLPDCRDLLLHGTFPGVDLASANPFQHLVL